MTATVQKIQTPVLTQATPILFGKAPAPAANKFSGIVTAPSVADAFVQQQHAHVAPSPQGVSAFPTAAALAGAKITSNFSSTKSADSGQPQARFSAAKFFGADASTGLSADQRAAEAGEKHSKED